MARWVERIVQENGIRSIICLMHPKELRYYDALGLDPDGLLGFYERNGILVRHLPWADPAHAKSAEERSRLLRQVEQIKVEALASFKELLKPVLVQCSAGIDRTAPVAAYILSSLGPGPGYSGCQPSLFGAGRAFSEPLGVQHSGLLPKAHLDAHRAGNNVLRREFLAQAMRRRGKT